jgi:hypothetical protein
MSDSVDVDNERRLKSLAKLNIGKNRANVGKLGTKKNPSEANQRILKQVKKAHEQIAERVAGRQDGYHLQDAKDLFSAWIQAVRDERRRAESLRKGGADAARILALERKKSITRGTDEIHEDEDHVVEIETEVIKPGEVSLVSSFSCLHPSIDGIDGILRQGVATAACALATQQTIGLYSLMSCFYLATLYRDGFRYGGIMYEVEIALFLYLSMANYRASCIPRPRLPNSVNQRSPPSLFHPSSIFITVFQAIVHISCMSWSISYAKFLGKQTASTVSIQKSKINFVGGAKSGGRIQSLVGALSAAPLHDDAEEEKTKRFFFRRPYKPNYETNSVFMFSILQSAITTLVNYKGKPFCRSILEDRELCRAFCFTIGFFFVCVTGSVPALTKLLEIKPFPSGWSKLTILGIAAVNIVACILVRFLADNLFGIETGTTTSKKGTIVQEEVGYDLAADAGEKLLQEESSSNANMLRMFCGLIFYFLLDITSEITNGTSVSTM